MNNFVRNYVFKYNIHLIFKSIEKFDKAVIPNSKLKSWAMIRKKKKK